MRHGMANKKLNRTSEHRKALLKNMLNSLIKYEQITTTLPKAKFLKPQADKIITLGKKETLQTTKMLMTKLQDIKSANKVKKTLSKRYEKRSGGYTRIIKAGFRYGDNAPMAVANFFSSLFSLAGSFFFLSILFASTSLSTNSITAIGALSPYLKPALIILVYPPLLFSYLFDKVFFTLLAHLISCSLVISILVVCR